MKILVVEDNLDIKEILDYILSDEGYEVVTCTDGSSLNALDNINPDIILMDEILAGSRGSELCKKLKTNADSRHIPVVLISAMPRLEEIANKCGADAYIEKPFNIHVVIDVLKRFAR